MVGIAIRVDQASLLEPGSYDQIKAGPYTGCESEHIIRLPDQDKERAAVQEVAHIAMQAGGVQRLGLNGAGTDMQSGEPAAIIVAVCDQNNDNACPKTDPEPDPNH